MGPDAQSPDDGSGVSHAAPPVLAVCRAAAYSCGVLGKLSEKAATIPIYRIRCISIVVLILALHGLLPSMAAAQEWHELYSDGVGALRNGQAQDAVGLLERAIEARPEPGVLVPTYGTNFVPRYFPYLRLAEAHILLDAVEDATETLRVSARLGIEPADEREALEARLSAPVAARRPSPDPVPDTELEPEAEPDPTTSLTRPSAPEPAVVREAAGPEEPAPPLAEVALPTADIPAAPAPAAAVEPVRPSIAAPEPAAAAPRPPEPAAAEPRAREPGPTLIIVSDPPGSLVFLDDEPVGRTDPQTGRLRLTTLAAGTYRVRLSSEGRQDVIREVEVANAPVTVEALLPGRQASPRAASPTSQPAGPRVRVVPIAGLAVGLTFVMALLIWGLRRRQSKSVVSGRQPSTVSDPGTEEVFPAPFGDYSLLRRIGKGGMAAVYEATKHGEALALKRPLSGFLDDDRFRQRFLREAELGRALHHPNIIRIFDHGEVGNTPYFTMELVQGETLAARLDREGRLELSEAAHLTAQAAEALDYAHSKGVIHRDLKPSNIMVEPSGGVKVMDYGIARSQHLEEVTTTRTFLGTASYGAPEIVQGASQPASDIYSLGVVFFEMLTGNVPFTGDTALAVIRHHSTTPPPAPSSLNHALPTGIDRLVLQMLSKDPADRPSAEALRNALSDYLPEGR
jgi:hypothetical protein